MAAPCLAMWLLAALFALSGVAEGMPQRQRGPPRPDEQLAWLGLDELQEAEMTRFDERGDEARRELLDWLLDGSYYERLTSLVDRNPELVDYLQRFSVSYYTYDLSMADLRQSLINRTPTYECMLGMMVSMLNKNILPDQAVVLSLFALRCQVSGPFWSVLSGLHVLASKEWTRAAPASVFSSYPSPSSQPSSRGPRASGPRASGPRASGPRASTPRSAPRSRGSLINRSSTRGGSGFESRSPEPATPRRRLRAAEFRAAEAHFAYRGPGSLRFETPEFPQVNWRASLAARSNNQRATEVQRSSEKWSTTTCCSSLGPNMRAASTLFVESFTRRFR